MSSSLLAILCAFASAAVSIGAGRWPLLLRLLAFGLLGASGFFAIVGGAQALIHGITATYELQIGLPWLPWHLALDPLSGFFLCVVGVLTIAVSLYGPGYVREFENSQFSFSALGIFTGLFVAGMQMVLLAADAYSFMIAWEIMSLASYFLVIYQYTHSANRRAAFLYLLMAHIGALCILMSFGILAGFSGGFSFDAMRHAELSWAWATIAFALAFIGFGMKAGLMPLHAWLPDAHPAAPSHISALMSGVMLKVAVYGFVRVVFEIMPTLYWGWGVAVLLIGLASALLGVLYTLMQNDLKRLLAYCSVENIGVIFVALGLSMIFISTGHPLLGALGFVAALYHVINHALFKGLLFLGAGAIMHSTHERDLNHMGGLIHKLPFTAVFFLIGCLSISSLPPFNGFVSEWLTFQTALQATSLESGILRTLIPITAALLALTGALAAACFVKVYGVAFLGLPRTRHTRKANEVDLGMLSAQGLLALLCVLFGIFPTWVIQILSAVPQFLFDQDLSQATAEGWMWLTPISAETASYSAPLVVVGLLLAWWLGREVIRRGNHQTRRADAWECGFGPLNSRMQYTSTAFSMPIRRIFGAIWQVDEQIDETRDQGLRTSSIRYQLQIIDRSWAALYAPIERWVLWVSRRVSRLQTGNIRQYLMYSFFTLLLLLWLIT